MPGVLSLIYIGAFEASRNWGDVFSLMFFGMLGWAMKHFRWPRPPLVLGFILGDVIERYMFISIERYGISWMLRPVVVVMFILAGMSLLRPLLQDVRSHGGLKNMVSHWGHPQFAVNNLFSAGLLCLFVAMVGTSFQWAFAARIIPTIVGTGAVLFCALSLINDVFGMHERGGGGRSRCQVAKNPHGYRFENRAPSRQDHRHARIFVFRMDGRVRRLYGAHRSYSHSADLHHHFHARRGARTVADRRSDGGSRGAADLRGV